MKQIWINKAIRSDHIQFRCSYTNSFLMALERIKRNLLDLKYIFWSVNLEETVLNETCDLAEDFCITLLQ